MGELVLRAPGTRVELLVGLSRERARFQQDRASHGHVSLMQRDEWSELEPGRPTWMLATLDTDGLCTDAIVLSVHHSRALPRHVILRAEHLRPCPVGSAVRATTLRGLRDLARRNSNVLRVHLQFLLDPVAGDDLSHEMHDAGFEGARFPSGYGTTAVVGLNRDEDEIFAGFHKTARYNVRSAEKRGAVLRPVTDPNEAPRLRQLADETFGRTGGSVDRRAWEAVIRLSARHPTLSRLIGLYDPDVEGADALLSFAWGCFHGDHGQYYFAASTRRTEKKISLGYAPVWDLVKWSRRLGGRWFDLGGITVGTADDADPLGGISDFKRYFSSEIHQVGFEWQFEPHPAKAWAANTIGALLRRASETLAQVQPQPDR